MPLKARFTLTFLEETKSPVTTSCRVHKSLLILERSVICSFTLLVITPNEEVFTNGQLIVNWMIRMHFL